VFQNVLVRVLWQDSRCGLLGCGSATDGWGLWMERKVTLTDKGLG
jgi:hypothetical protein